MWRCTEGLSTYEQVLRFLNENDVLPGDAQIVVRNDPKLEEIFHVFWYDRRSRRDSVT